MKISYFPTQTAKTSGTILSSFLEGCKKNGFEIVENSYDADCAVIWSMLWHGRMAQNLQVYEHYQKNNKPVIIIEVGALIRGITWKIALDNIDSSGYYPNKGPIDYERPKKIGLALEPINLNRSNRILIAGQNRYSNQWRGMPPPEIWVKQKIKEIREHFDLPIEIRPHPRDHLHLTDIDNISVQIPKYLPGTYSKFDINFDYQFLVSHNSGPAIQAILMGTPVICHSSSLAFPMSCSYLNITIPDRTQWFLDLCHTEWTVEEIAQGIPLKRLLPEIKRRLS